MKRFFKKICTFFIPIICVLGFLEILVREIPNDYSLKKNYLTKHSDEIEVLFLGSSHAYYGINPDYITSYNSFNASYISQSLNYDYKILKNYGSNLSSLKAIVIPIDYLTLYGSLETGVEKWRAKNYIIYYQMYQLDNIKNYFEIFLMNQLLFLESY